MWLPPVPETDSTAEAGRSDELWKERLGLTTGSFVIWGLLLLQFWPVVKRFQTHMPINPFGSESSAVRPEYTGFIVMIVLVALGWWVLALAALHIITRGLWLIGNKSNDGNNQFRTMIRNVAYDSYVGVFIVTALILAWLLLVGILGIPLHLARAWLMPYLDNREWLFTLIFVSAFILILIALGKLIFNFRGSAKVINRLREFLKSVYPFVKPMLNRFSLTRLYVYAMLFLGSMFVIQQAASTLDLQLNKHIVYSGMDRGVEIYVELGGSTSYPEAAQLSVRHAQGGQVQTFQLSKIELADGRYAAYLPLKDETRTNEKELGSDLYTVELTYKHPTVNFSPYFYHRHTSVIDRFSVVKP